jgi:hypothetical protein
VQWVSGLGWVVGIDSLLGYARASGFFAALTSEPGLTGLEPSTAVERRQAHWYPGTGGESSLRWAISKAGSAVVEYPVLKE